MITVTTRALNEGQCPVKVDINKRALLGAPERSYKKAFLKDLTFRETVVAECALDHSRRYEETKASFTFGLRTTVTQGAFKAT